MIRKILLFLLKIGLSVAILGVLLWQAASNDAFTQLLETRKHWGSLGLGFAFSFLAVFLTITRWWWLMRIQGATIPLPLTLRVGYIGYLFNLAPMGLVGGDLLKAWMLIHHEKEKQDVAPIVLASIFIDRMIGLYALFVMASLAVLGTGMLWNPPNYADASAASVTNGICIAVLVAFGVGTVAWLVLLCPAFSAPKPAKKSSRWVELLQKIVLSVRMYRHYPGKLGGVLAMSVLIHTCFAISVYFIAAGLWEAYPSFLQHLYISPISMSTSAIPLPFGPYEAVLDRMYRDVLGVYGRGLTVALAYRIVCLGIASLGMIFYFTSRAEVRETMREAKK
ncbi:MAG: lysylphosphatidylglycerol synthase transmembrane domain-containing protein [Planctomycetia bacterium]|nr:lysylphosphatidylglycerol synthase transmembrane domain-containing protein [Planctomycetia bacterium]